MPESLENTRAEASPGGQGDPRADEVLQALPVAALVIDREHRVVRWNRALERLSGVSAPEVLGTRDHWRLAHTERHPLLADLVLELEPGKGEWPFAEMAAEPCAAPAGAWWSQGLLRGQDGDQRPVKYLACALRDAAGRAVGAVQAVLVLERDQARRELEYSRDRFGKLFGQAAYGAVLAAEGRIILANPAMARMYGCDTPEELSGREVCDLVVPIHHDRVRKAFRLLAQGRYRPEVVDLPCLRPDGSQFWIEGHTAVMTWQGRPAALLTGRDVSAQRRREHTMAEETKSLRSQNVVLRSSLGERYRFAGIVGKSRAMQEVYDRILMAAASEAGVIIYGESGTGKDLVARAIHANSLRTKSELVTVNCGAIPASLMESEFFGYKKGAFTGADKDKRGYLELAHRGTLFLDEVGELPLDLQVKLLRALESGEYTPVGGGMARRADVRIVAATNRKLDELVERGGMREDFYYRVHVIPINLPPLRERREDIMLLVQHFLGIMDKSHLAGNLPAEVSEALHNYNWPGNVRELMNVLQRYLTLGRLDMPGSLPRPAPAVRPAVREAAETAPADWGLSQALADFERAHLQRALEQTRWRRGAAAELLGISRKTLFRKMRSLGLG